MADLTPLCLLVFLCGLDQVMTAAQISHETNPKLVFSTDKKLRATDCGLVSFSERLVTACISAFLIASMASLAPLLVLIFLRGHGVGILDSYRTFQFWGSAATIVAGGAGFVLGADRTTDMFGHLFCTHRPKNIGLTLLLWISLT